MLPLKGLTGYYTNAARSPKEVVCSVHNVHQGWGQEHTPPEEPDSTGRLTVRLQGSRPLSLTSPLSDSGTGTEAKLRCFADANDSGGMMTLPVSPPQP